MRQILIALCAIAAVATAAVLSTVPSEHTEKHLLGATKCTRGPGFWCQNIKTSAKCKATTWCIEKQWTNMEVDDDKDSVCGICKDMVTQARDQLESNVTQEDLKAVFEGSCALMKIKPIVKECDVLVDEFIPELVETLASQMNPSVVCSVAGLCNSAHMDKLIEYHEKKTQPEHETTTVSLSDDELEPNECSRCYTIADHMKNKLNTASRDSVLENMLTMCGRMGSFSDACSSIVLVYFSSIYSHLQDNFVPNNICHLSGQCSGKFHKHEEPGKNPQVEIRPLSSVGMVDVDDDLTCKLCDQLVEHLKDLLVANTTEIEFQQVLTGLCQQTKSFAPQCKSIVDEYYPEIYNYLVHRLNPNDVCEMAKICPVANEEIWNRPIAPLLPTNTQEIGARIFNGGKNLGENGAGVRRIVSKTEADEMQLPFDRLLGSSLMVAPQMDARGQKTCAFCELLMDELQQIITNPATEDEVKVVLDKVCKKLPESVQDTCREFVSSYGDALVSLISRNIDSSVICPEMNVCPSKESMDQWKNIPKEFMLKSEVEEKPSCPLCVLAIDKLYHIVEDEKTEASIERALDKLCERLPNNIENQCESLVQGYSKELVGMLIADMTPEEICVTIKLCQSKAHTDPKNPFPVDKDGEIMTNEIPDYYPLAESKPNVKDGICVVCEYVMHYVEKAMRNKSTKDEIEHVVHGICNHMPKSVSQECNGFVDQYADIVIDMLSNDVSPKAVCTLMGICQENKQLFKDSVTECAICQTVTSTIDELLGDSTVDNEIEEVVSGVCQYVPAAQHDKCKMIVAIYQQSIINIIRQNGNIKKICRKIALCDAANVYALNLTKHHGSIESTVDHGENP